MRCIGKTRLGIRCRRHQQTPACHHHITAQQQPPPPVKFNFINDGGNKPQMYCGSSLILPDAYDLFGTRNKCLRKGVGIGMGASDSKRNEFLYKPYTPPAQKLYCGDKTVLPPGYAGFGDLSVCLKKGVGAGLLMDQQKRKAFQEKPKPPLGKKEIVELAQRLGIRNVDGKTRRAVELEISRKMASNII